jgi:hypothetical protein
MTATRVSAQESTPRLTNEDVVKMVRAGQPSDVIISRIKKSETDFDTSPSALVGLPKRGVPNEILLAMLESDPLGSNTHPVRKKGKRLTAAEVQQLQASVLAVWSEFGTGTGFIISRAGLVLTSQHVIGPSEYVAVQFDKRRKMPAKVLASDPETDVAVLWVNLAAVTDASVATLPDPEEDEVSVVEGERLVTVGSGLHERKLFTTGIASKVNKRSIISDINLNQVEAGGPLFNSLGEAVGITTFLQPDVFGPPVFGILRIEETFPLIDQARKRMKRTTIPVARFLPVDPVDPFPLDAIKTVKDLDLPSYSFDVGEFKVSLMTPAFRYRLAVTNVNAYKDFKNWAEYVSGYQSVLFISAAVRSGESKTEFDNMRLLCGDREVVPIHPAKVGTDRGVYAYPPKAISAACGTVTLVIHSAGTPAKVRTRDLDRKTIARVDDDFSPYYQRYGHPPIALFDPSPTSDQALSNSKRKWWEFSKPRK